MGRQHRERSIAVAEHSLWGSVRLPARGVHLVHAIADDDIRAFDVSHPAKPVKGQAIGDVHSTWGSLAVVMARERLESAAHLITAHHAARDSGGTQIL